MACRDWHIILRFCEASILEVHTPGKSGFVGGRQRGVFVKGQNPFMDDSFSNTRRFLQSNKTAAPYVLRAMCSKGEPVV
jgi:hypothetical protein